MIGLNIGLAVEIKGHGCGEPESWGETERRNECKMR